MREEGLVEEQGQRHRFDGVRVGKTRLDGPRDRFGREPGEAHRLQIRSDAYLPSDAKAQVLCHGCVLRYDANGSERPDSRLLRAHSGRKLREQLLGAVGVNEAEHRNEGG